MKTLILVSAFLLAVNASAVVLGDHGQIIVKPASGDTWPVAYTVELQNEGTRVGLYTTEKLDELDAGMLEKNAERLNVYLDFGIKVELPNNPSAKDFHKAIRSLEETKDIEILRKMYRADRVEADNAINELKTKFMDCRDDKRHLRSDLRHEMKKSKKAN